MKKNKVSKPPYSSAQQQQNKNMLDVAFSKLGKASGWMLFGGVSAGVLGYLFQVIMGRMLTMHQYGLFNALMALFMIFSAPLSTLMMLVSRKVATYRTLKDHLSLGHFFVSINMKGGGLGILFIIIIGLFSEQILRYAKLEQLEHIWLISLLLLVSIPMIINQGFLQGLQFFTLLSSSSTFNVAIKILFSSLLVWLGFGIGGAIWGAIIASVIIIFGTYYYIRKDVKDRYPKGHKLEHLPIRSMVPVLVANVAFTAMTQIDMVLVNYLFSGASVGQYAAASILGKAVMYLPSGIAMALFPLVAENHAKGESSVALLHQALAFVSILSALCALFYFFFGEWVITLLYGIEYQQAGQLLRYYGIALFPMSLVMVAEYYLIAKSQVVFAYLFVLIFPFQLLAVFFFHDSLIQIVLIMGAVSLLLACAGFAVLWRKFRRVGL